MAEDGRARVLRVEKFVEEEMDADPKWPERKVADVLGESEGGKGDGERQVREGRLEKHHQHSARRIPLQKGSACACAESLTSTAMPGTNITTANAWKNFLLALTDRVGILWSAASIIWLATPLRPDTSPPSWLCVAPACDGAL